MARPSRAPNRQRSPRAYHPRSGRYKAGSHLRGGGRRGQERLPTRAAPTASRDDVARRRRVAWKSTSSAGGTRQRVRLATRAGWRGHGVGHQRCSASWNSMRPVMCSTSSAGNSSFRRIPVATADATAHCRWLVPYLTFAFGYPPSPEATARAANQQTRSGTESNVGTTSAPLVGCSGVLASRRAPKKSMESPRALPATPQRPSRGHIPTRRPLQPHTPPRSTPAPGRVCRHTPGR